jgi:hypothetical protein
MKENLFKTKHKKRKYISQLDSLTQTQTLSTQTQTQIQIHLQTYK